jgi:hypothetical protein
MPVFANLRVDIRMAPKWTQAGVLAGSKLRPSFNKKGQIDAPACLAQLKTATRRNFRKKLPIRLRDGRPK